MFCKTFVFLVIHLLCCFNRQLIQCEEIFDSGSGNNEFRDNIHNGKFVIYDQIDRQMVESSMDEVMASGEDESFPFMTKVLPDFQHKDSQTIHTYMLPPEAGGHHFDNFDSPLSMEINDNKFGYHVSGNHQIQAERPFKPPNQRVVDFKTSESAHNPSFVANTPTTTAKPITFKPRPRERPNLSPTSFIRHSDKVVPSPHDKPFDKTRTPPTNLLNTLRVTPAPALAPAPAPIPIPTPTSSSSSIRAVHVPREDDKKHSINANNKPKKYFPEPVKMSINPRFESQRIKSVNGQSSTVTITTPKPVVSLSNPPSPPQLTFPVYSRPSSSVSSTKAPTQTSQWRTNSRFPSWNDNSFNNNHNTNYKNNHNNNNNNHNNHEMDDYIPGDKMSSQSSYPHRYHVESPGAFSDTTHNSVTHHFTDLDDYEGTSASDEIGQTVVHPAQHSADSLTNPNHTPLSTRVAVQNHPDLTEKQRDSLLKILESYYKLIHQFNIDFRKLINESKGKASGKENGTVIIEPIAVEPSLKYRN